MPVSPISESIDCGDGAGQIDAEIYGSGAPGPAPLVLHLRGGAFMAAAEGSRLVARLLAEAGAVVVSADYPVGRAHPFPGAVEVLYRLLRHLHGHRGRWAARGSKLFVAGEEAGGNLAASLAMMARDRLGPPLAGQILLSPMLDAEMATCSYRDAQAGPVGCKWADGWHAYLGTPDKAAHPYAVPSCGSRLAGLPAALVLTAPDDPMKDESLSYASRLAAAGVEVRALTVDAGGWPDALSGPPDAKTPPPWAAQVRDAFAHFFSAVTPGLAPAALPARS